LGWAVWGVTGIPAPPVEAPQLMQNAAPWVSFWPQLGQNCAACWAEDKREAPQLLQNFASSASIWPHFGQVFILFPPFSRLPLMGGTDERNKHTKIF
jgi:hypothetical protein